MPEVRDAEDPCRMVESMTHQAPWTAHGGICATAVMRSASFTGPTGPWESTDCTDLIAASRKLRPGGNERCHLHNVPSRARLAHRCKLGQDCALFAPTIDQGLIRARTMAGGSP